MVNTMPTVTNQSPVPVLSGRQVFGPASARWCKVGGILHFVGSGVITESVLRDMQALCAELSFDCAAVVSDQSASVFAITPKRIVGLALLFDVFGPRITAPLALVLFRGALPQFRTFSSELAVQGRTRAVFVDADQAWRWAAAFLDEPSLR
jgi:hypothetical protein